MNKNYAMGQSFENISFNWTLTNLRVLSISCALRGAIHVHVHVHVHFHVHFHGHFHVHVACDLLRADSLADGA